MEVPKRKGLRLSGYDYAQNGAYFVTICTKDRAPVFGHIVGGGLRAAPPYTGRRRDRPLQKINYSTSR